MAIGVDLAAEINDIPRPSQENQRQVSLIVFLEFFCDDYSCQ